MTLKEKSCYIVTGSKKAKQNIEKKLKKKPLLLYDKPMKEVKSNKYLGCLLSPSVSETVSNTINSRIGLAKRSIYEIRTVVEDIRADHIGAVQVGLELWQSSVLSSLLYSSEVWSEVPPKSLKQLEETNSLFLANLLGVSKRGCPEVNLYIETSSLLIPNQILLSQLLFLHHIASLPTAPLVNEVYESMKEKNFPGILRICQPYLTEWSMTEIKS